MVMKAGSLFWTKGSVVQPDGAIKTMPIDATTPALLASTRRSPQKLKVDESHVYWIEAVDPKVGSGLSVWRVAHGLPLKPSPTPLPNFSTVPTRSAPPGTATTPSFKPSAAASTTSDGPDTSNGPKALAKSEVVIASIPFADRIDVNDGRLVFVSSSEVGWGPTSGGSPSVVATGQKSPHGPAADKTHTYWSADDKIWQAELPK